MFINIFNCYVDFREFVMVFLWYGLYCFGWFGYFNWNNVDFWCLNGELVNVLCNYVCYRR